MEIIGSGIDIIEIRRFREARWQDRLAEYFLLPQEIKDLKASSDKEQFMASRFAAKEAVIKSFPGEISYKDFIVSKNGNKPCIININPAMNGYRFFVSISHSLDYAAACACAIK